MTQQAAGRAKSVRIKKEPAKYASSASPAPPPPMPRRTAAAASTASAAAGTARPKRAAAAGHDAHGELEELRRWKADAEALLLRTGCASLGEASTQFGALRRAAAIAASTNGGASSASSAAASAASRAKAGPVWARLQNCRGPEKQKADDIYLMCMGPKQKAADIRNPPGLSAIVMTHTDPKDTRPIARPRVVRLFGQPTSRHGADPAHKSTELLFNATVKTAASKADIAEKSLRVGGLSAFMLPDGSLNLRLRRSTAGQSDGWIGPPQNGKGNKPMPTRWVPTKWQQNRWKEDDKTADDNVRPFSVEIEFVSGDKILVETPFRIQSTGDSVMDCQHMKKKRKASTGGQQPPQKRRSRVMAAPTQSSTRITGPSSPPTGPSPEMISDEEVFSSGDFDEESPRSPLDALAEANAADLDRNPGGEPLLPEWASASPGTSLELWM